MKLMHLSDLHIGKRVNGFSMLEDQKFVLKQILHAAEEEQPDGVLIAGDVYDKQIPSGEAVSVFDDFLVKLAQFAKVYIISGNHDSAERVAFGGRLMEYSGVYISPVYNGNVQPLQLEDEFGPVHIWLLPFVKPTNVRSALKRDDILTYTEAMQAAVDALELDPTARNVAVAHQFLTGASTCDSEESTSVGGLDDVSADVFSIFDYTALGHLHGPQKVGSETIRYAGSPLKYSFSEISQRKSITMVELGEKGSAPGIRELPLQPLHEMRELKGSFEELTQPEMYQKFDSEDYYQLILTDEDDIPDAGNRLRSYYPNWMVLKYDNSRTRNEQELVEISEIQNRTRLELFAEFFQLQNNREMSDFQRSFMEELLEEEDAQ